MEPNNSISICLLLIRATGKMPDGFRRKKSPKKRLWFLSTMYLWRALIASLILYSIYLFLK